MQGSKYLYRAEWVAHVIANAFQMLATGIGA